MNVLNFIDSANFDKLIHQYFAADWNILWEVIRDRIPELKDT